MFSATRATLTAAAAGAAIVLLPLVPDLDFNQAPSVAAFIFVLYLLALCLIGWPCIALLRLIGFRSRRSIIVAGTAIVAIANFFLSLGFGGTTHALATQVLWAFFGALSGATAGYMLSKAERLTTHREQIDDRRTGYKSQTVRYKAFFSYSRADDFVADWLWEYLDRYQLPQDGSLKATLFSSTSASLHPIFRDRFDLSAGGELLGKLRSALERSDSLIVLCTPASAKSAWVDEEVQTFLAMGRADRILPVIAAGEPDSAEPSKECLPPSLRGLGLLGADLRNHDLHGGRRGDGKQLAPLKIVAGMLRVDFDVLVRREHTRQLTRSHVLFAVVALTSSLAVAASFLAYVSVGAFQWSSKNLSEAFRHEIAYITRLNTDGGLGAVEKYVEEKNKVALEGHGRLLCFDLLDFEGKPIDPKLRVKKFPVADRIAGTHRFSLEEQHEFNYGGSPFHRKLDGLSVRITEKNAVAVSYCNYKPPMFYGVFKAYFDANLPQ